MRESDPEEISGSDEVGLERFSGSSPQIACFILLFFPPFGRLMEYTVPDIFLLVPQRSQGCRLPIEHAFCCCWLRHVLVISSRNSSAVGRDSREEAYESLQDSTVQY